FLPGRPGGAMRHIPLAALLFALALGLAPGPARADDWPQFRRDAGRSAASRDKLKLPLTEMWSWTTPARESHTPLFHAVIWKGRVFFVAREGGRRQLVCADAKNGTIAWRKPLEAAQLNLPL